MQPLYLFGQISRLSLRSWVLIVGVLVALIPWQPRWMKAVDSGLFVLTSYLVEAPKGSSKIGIVEVDSDEFGRWQADLHEGGKLAALLSNILHSSDATVGLILQTPLDQGSVQVDAFLNTLAEDKTASSKSAREVLERKRLLTDLLNDPRVVIGVASSAPEVSEPIATSPGVLAAIPPELTDWLWPLAALPESNMGAAELPQRAIIAPFGARRFAVARDHTTGSPQALFLADFLAAASLKSGNRSQWDISWQRDQGLVIGERKLPLSPEGEFLAFNATNARMAPLINVMSLADGLARGAFPEYVFIAAEGDRNAEQLAIALYSVLHGHVAATPWWQTFVSPLTTLFVTLLLVALVPRLTLFSSSLTLLLLAITLVVSQSVLAIIRSWWLPVAEQLLWMWVGFGFIRLWVNYRDAWRQLETRADTATLFQISGLIDAGNLGEASQLLGLCSSSPQVLQKYYELGSAYAAKRQYRTAIEIYQALVARQRNFRDTEQKISALEAMVATPSVPALKPRDVDATMVLSQAHIERPVLGRYEIREELGRGAMGIVYLGFDPRIARQVAIKTLNYGQFQPHELANIKNRFFREAEAAGRLTHPNIVSVYDVGEERDLAFIAMDYVEGKALNAFIDPNCLLPVFEVYRIVADVATALEYAHNSNIVHRDIKPGNIIYNPSPYQIKVTDFGIARLMDDSKTSTGEILGSPLYMSPEQLRGRKVDRTADVFSLGVTFYQLLCGHLPFAGDNLASLTYEIIHGKHRSVRSVRKDLPSSAARITNQCLQKESQDRYESAGELALVLKKAIKRDFANEARKTGYL